MTHQALSLSRQHFLTDSMRKSLTILLSTLVLVQHSPAQYDPHKVEPFIAKYCIDCHNADKQKGDIRLDKINTFDPDIWQLVYDQLYHEEMPPSKKPQPSKQETETIMSYILKQTEDKDTFTVASTTGYRKLNHREYNYTIKDLLGLNDGDFQPSNYIYSDTVEKGFDTEAESLIMSSDLLLEYMTAAEKSIHQALFTEDYTKPSIKEYHLPLKRLSGGDKRFSTGSKTSFITRDGGAQFFSKSDKALTSTSGNYKITIEAEPIDQFRYDNGNLFPPYKKPFKLNLGTKGISSSGGSLKQTFTLENKKTTYSQTLWLDSGYTIFIEFANGAGKPPASVRQAQRRRKIPRNVKPILPGIKITDIKIEGPFIEEWPAPSYKTTFGRKDIPDLENSTTREQILSRFIARAYRRIPTKDEVSTYKTRLETEYLTTKSWHQAFIKTLSAVIVSPDFLYIKTGQGKLNDYELASRLSYFLWSSMPDLELLNLAHSGRLSEPAVYNQQIQRLLQDSKSNRFMESFATQWLSLDKLGTMPPDTKGKYRDYYKVKNDIIQETLEYFKYILRDNRSISEFIDSDYTFLNKKLADYYHIPFYSKTEGFQKTTLPAGSIRGGIITHASILTLTANGVETTPIERGHWILDELMGTPPPPPPKEVPALVPDLRQATTVREQLLKHREDPKCSECHLKMDPLGFALEAFDPIGKHRKKYETNLIIDTSGAIFDTPFKDITELKKILHTNDQVIARNLIIKLAEYAKGRKLNLHDLNTVKQITTESAKDGYKFKTMLERVINSDLITHH